MGCVCVCVYTPVNSPMAIREPVNKVRNFGSSRKNGNNIVQSHVGVRKVACTVHNLFSAEMMADLLKNKSPLNFPRLSHEIWGTLPVPRVPNYSVTSGKIVLNI